MTRRRIVALAAGAAAAVVVALGAYAAWFHLVSPWASGPGAHGDDPQILLHDEAELPDLPVWGQVRYDADHDCLYLATSRSWGTRHTLDERVDIRWPAPARPVVVDGERGVRIGGFLGRFGGTVIREGDLIEGAGIPTEQFDEASGQCDADAPAHVVGHVSTVASLDAGPGSILVDDFAASCGGVLILATNTTPEEPTLRWEVDGEPAGSERLRNDIAENVVLVEIGDEHGADSTVRYEVEGQPGLAGEVTGLRPCEGDEEPEWPEDARLFLDDA